MTTGSNKIILATFLVCLSFLLSGCTSQNINKEPATVSKKSPQVVILDSTWGKYTNNKHKYSINIPNEYFIKQGSCLKRENEKTYEYKAALSEIAVEEDETNTKIYPKTKYILSEDKSECILSEYATNDTEDSWNIQAFTTENTQDLENHIKNTFGQTCALEVLKPTKNLNIYDVIVTNNEDCTINSAYFFKYNEQTKSGVSILLGSTFTFNKDQNFGNNAYDEQMLASFEFID
jgi:hypothetical protein